MLLFCPANVLDSHLAYSFYIKMYMHAVNYVNIYLRISLISCVLFSLLSSTQDQIFGVCAMEIVESVLQGYNGSLIASGQTG